MSGWLGEDTGFHIALSAAVGILPAAIDTRPVVVAAVVGVAFAGHLSGSRLFNN